MGGKGGSKKTDKGKLQLYPGSMGRSEGKKMVRGENQKEKFLRDILHLGRVTAIKHSKSGTRRHAE